MKRLARPFLTVLCFMLFPGVIYALDGSSAYVQHLDYEHLESKTDYIAAHEPGYASSSAYSPKQRLHSYFQEITSKKLRQNITLEAGRLNPKNIPVTAPDGNIQGLKSNLTGSEAFMLSMPVQGYGLGISPYIVQAWRTNEFTSPYPGLQRNLPNWSHYQQESRDYADPDSTRWLGAKYSLDFFQPMLLQGNLVYGIFSDRYEDHKHESWQADMRLSYKSDGLATPEMWALFALGDDDNFQKEDSALPRPYRNINLGQNALSAPQESGIFGPGPGRYSLAQAVVDHKAGSYAAPGLWQIGFGLSDIKIWDRIEYSLGLAYGQGTYNHELPQEYRMGLTTKDSYLEARLDQRYQVYENLAAIMELGYATLDLDPEIWGPEKEEDAYLMTFGLSYEF